MIAEEPGLTGVAFQDAYVGAVGEHLARRWGLDIPAWADDSRRFLDRPNFPEHMELATPVVSGSTLATELTGEMWEPILRRAIERGEIRPDLDMSAVAEWLALIQFILVGRLDFSSADDPGHRTMLRTFVLPAFLPVAAVQPSG